MTHIVEKGSNTVTVAEPRSIEKENRTQSVINLNHFPNSGICSLESKETNSHLFPKRSMASNDQSDLNFPCSLLEHTASASGEKGTDRRQERAMRNRQSALASRERKRQYIVDLESEREALEVETRNLRVRVSTLESENSYVSAELVSLQNELDKLKQLVFAGQVNTDVSDSPVFTKECGDDSHPSKDVAAELGHLARPNFGTAQRLTNACTTSTDFLDATHESDLFWNGEISTFASNEDWLCDWKEFFANEKTLPNISSSGCDENSETGDLEESYQWAMEKEVKDDSLAINPKLLFV